MCVGKLLLVYRCGDVYGFCMGCGYFVGGVVGCFVGEGVGVLRSWFSVPVGFVLLS